MFPLLETAIAFAAAMLTASLLVSAAVQAIQKVGRYRADTVSGMLRSVIHGFRSFYNDPELMAVDYPDGSDELGAAQGRVFAGEKAFVRDILADPALHARGDAITYGDDPTRLAQLVEYISASDLIAIARNHAESASVSDPSDAQARAASVSSPTPPPAESGSVTILARPGDERYFLPASWLYEKGGAEATQRLAREKPYATLAKFAEYVQHWYPTFEATSTQAFRGRIRRLTLLVACTLVVLLNIDSVRLAVTLYRNSGAAYAERVPELKEQASRLGVTAADLEPIAEGAAQPSPADPSLLLSALDDPTLGLGWQGSAIVDTWCSHTGRCPSTLAPLGGWQTASATILWLLGLALSCAMLSLGAPFWYNALAGLLNLKNALQTKNERADAAKSARPLVAITPPAAPSTRADGS
ncbi:MAG TPA: hypothetical protein VJV79_31835 [Polyangiaceae bacterium]|nr:hypothetical protein [Polyangiaceae bacterium]